MRKDDALPLDMLLAARKIQRFVVGMTYQEFAGNELVQSAVMREFQVIGEAVRLVTEETKRKYAELQWRKIAGMRNRLVHEYFYIQLGIVWQTILDNLPTLVAQLEQRVPPDLGMLE